MPVGACGVNGIGKENVAGRPLDELLAGDVLVELLFVEVVFDEELFCVELLCNGTMVIVGQRLCIYKIAAQAATTESKIMAALVLEKCLSMC